MQCCLNACCLLQLGDYRKDIRDLFFALFYGRVLNYYDAKQQQFWSSIFYYSLFFKFFLVLILLRVSPDICFFICFYSSSEAEKNNQTQIRDPLVQYLTGLRATISSFFLSFLFRSCSVFFSLSGTRRNFDCMSLITSCRSDSEGNVRWHTGQQGSLSSVS